MNAKISESVSNYLSTSPIPHFIDGDWQPSADGQTWNVINPADGSVLATTSLGDARTRDQPGRGGCAQGLYRPPGRKATPR